MKNRPPHNLVASIRQRLLNISRARSDEFQHVLVRYALERFLYRLSKSHYGDQFVLKGAMLLQLWTDQPHRSTLDLDLLAMNSAPVAKFETIFKEVCSIPSEEDGLHFPASEIRGEQIREEQRYTGVRIYGIGFLGKARIPIQTDIGFGDVVTPHPQEVNFPSLLELPAPVMMGYSKETVVAEKYEAMLTLGMANSRMKDFYDVWVLATRFDFDGAVLQRAIQATFQRRGTLIPSDKPTTLTSEFWANHTKITQWCGFAKRGQLRFQPKDLESVVHVITDFLWPITEAISTSKAFRFGWTAGGPWRPI